MSETTDAEQAERERKFAEYDASVKGSVRPDGLDKLFEKLTAAVTYSYESGSDGYQQSADAMWKAAEAAFNWAAGVVGATGFQASWAALRFYGAVMHIDGPFMVTKLSDAIYPQYDLPARLTEFVNENHGWLADKAKEKLAQYADEPGTVHPNVLAHWQKLAGGAA